MSKKFLIHSKDFWKSYLLLFFLFVWLRIILIVIENFVNEFVVTHSEVLIVYATYCFSIMVFSLLGAISSETIERQWSLRIWILTTIISCFVYLLVPNGNMLILYPFLGGLSFGFGLPVNLSYFGDCTSILNRGRMSSFLFFTISLTFPFLMIMSKFFAINILLLFSLIFFIFLFFLLPKQENKLIVERKIRYSHILTDKRFLSYFVPWCMFCFIDALEAPLLGYFLVGTFGRNFRDSVLFIETATAAFSVIIVGFIIDLYGRKEALIYGFVTLGVAYAIVGVFPHAALSWYFYSIIFGIASGFFAVIFIFAIWGDLSLKGLREKYYAIGSLPYFFGVFISKLSMPYLEVLPVSASFSLAGFFLFLAIIPLLYAPETLPEKLIRQRELRKYVEKAKKIREKYEKTGD